LPEVGYDEGNLLNVGANSKPDEYEVFEEAVQFSIGEV